MNILLGCNHLHELGGSEQHLYTLAKGFKRLGDNVYVLLGNFTLKGSMSEILSKELNIEVDEMPTGIHFDAVFLSHTSTVNRFIEEVYSRNDLSFNDENIYQICHGIFSSLEMPHSWHKLKHIAISKEVEQSIKKKNGSDYNVITVHNPIDVHHFHFTNSNKIVKNVYSLSQNDDFNSLLLEICNEKGFNFSKNNKHTNPNPDIRGELSNADLVFSLGRGCYEAMSMGKNVIIADSRGYMNDSLMDGLVDDTNFLFFLENNCSGRYSKKQATKESILAEIDKYSLQNTTRNRVMVENFLSVGNTIKKLKSICNL